MTGIGPVAVRQPHVPIHRMPGLKTYVVLDMRRYQYRL